MKQLAADGIGISFSGNTDFAWRSFYIYWICQTDNDLNIWRERITHRRARCSCDGEDGGCILALKRGCLPITSPWRWEDGRGPEQSRATELTCCLPLHHYFSYLHWTLLISFAHSFLSPFLPFLIISDIVSRASTRFSCCFTSVQNRGSYEWKFSAQSQSEDRLGTPFSPDTASKGSSSGMKWIHTTQI